MTIIPAIDIYNGKCVRLTQGKFENKTIYSSDPVAVAKQWESEGAQMVHVVDLNGAKTGTPKNMDLIKKIVDTLSIPVEVGGGLRDKKTIQTLIANGVNRVIIGTAAFENKALVKQLVKTFSANIVVALETKNGKLVTRGWQREIDTDFISSAMEFQKLGVQRFLYSDVIKDGTLTEPNFAEIKALRSVLSEPLIIGGGVSSVASIRTLQSLQVEGVVIGKALYEEKITLQEAISVC